MLRNLQAQMPAAGMHNQINMPLIILVSFNKMISAAQRTQAFLSPVQVNVFPTGQFTQPAPFIIPVCLGPDVKT